METKICLNCNKERPHTSFKKNLDGSFRRHSCNICMGLRERSKLKLEFLNAFDWKCTCCGESDGRFLTLDHINNDGNKHRENYNEQQIMYQAKKENWPKDKYTCLCFNCNCGRSANGGICPHKNTSKDNYKEKLLKTQYNLGRTHVATNTSNIEARVLGRKKQVENLRLVKYFEDLGFSKDQIEIAISKLQNQVGSLSDKPSPTDCA